MTDCPQCTTWLARRRDLLVPHVGHWVTRQEHDTPPRIIVERLVARAHLQHGSAA